MKKRELKYQLRQLESYAGHREVTTHNNLCTFDTTELDHFDAEHLVLDEFGEPCGENFLPEKL